MPVNINGNIISTGDITDVGVFKTKVNRDGLVLYLDAGDKDSYIGTGTSWVDMSDSAINGTLTSGTIYTSSDGGGFTFDGVNDTIQFGNSFTPSSPISLVNSFTIEQIYKVTAYQPSLYFGLTNVLLGKGNLSTINYLTQLTSDTSVSFVKRGLVGDNLYFHTFTVPTMQNNIKMLTFVVETLKEVKCYMNGVYISSLPVLGTAIEAQATESLYISIDNANDMEFIGNYYGCCLYNRALNPYEISENFQAIRGRYSL